MFYEKLFPSTFEMEKNMIKHLSHLNLSNLQTNDEMNQFQSHWVATASISIIHSSLAKLLTSIQDLAGGLSEKYEL